jgi:type II secretory pathway component PulK
MNNHQQGFTALITVIIITAFLAIIITSLHIRYFATLQSLTETEQHLQHDFTLQSEHNIQNFETASL